MTLPARPTTAPDWADSGSIVQPTSDQIAAGWAPAQKPPAQFTNWWQNLAGNWLKYLDAMMMAQVFGSGADGVGTFDGTTACAGATLSGGTYTLTRDVYYTTAVFSAPVKTMGYAIYANISISTTTGAYFTGGGATGPHAVPPSFGTSATTITASNTLVGFGGSGGLGGTGTGSAGTSPTVMKLVEGSPQTFFPFRIANIHQSTTIATHAIDYLRGGGAGGSGGGDGTNQGGTSGYGGPLFVFISPSITTSDTVFDASGQSPTAPIVGNVGGGGGGGGGATMFVYFTYTVGVSGSAFLSVGGTGAAGHGTGTGGSNGGAGLTSPIFVDLTTGTSATIPSNHGERGIGVMAVTGGSGTGYDYLDVTFATAFADTTYDHTVSVYNSDGNIIGYNLIQKSEGGMRIGVSARFNGEISWSAKVAT